jgi:hypothetical protein
MTTTSFSRSILLALGLGFVLATACFDDSVLENEDCASNADCAKSQECVQTEYQAMASNEASYGWCRPDGDGCAVGLQPGCECLREGSLYSCSSEDFSIVLCPTSQDDTCVCKLPTDLEPPQVDNSSCPS